MKREKVQVFSTILQVGKKAVFQNLALVNAQSSICHISICIPTRTWLFEKINNFLGMCSQS